MIKLREVCILSAAFGGLLNAAVINTNNAATVAAFQSGATVFNFEGIAGRTPQTITSYTAGNPVSSAAFRPGTAISCRTTSCSAWKPTFRSQARWIARNSFQVPSIPRWITLPRRAAASVMHSEACCLT